MRRNWITTEPIYDAQKREIFDIQEKTKWK